MKNKSIEILKKQYKKERTLSKKEKITLNKFDFCENINVYLTKILINGIN